MFASISSVVFPVTCLDLDDDDTDEDDDDSDDDFDRDDEDDDESDEDDDDEDDEEPETWQVSGRAWQEYSDSGTGACESPKGRLNLTFRPLTA